MFQQNLPKFQPEIPGFAFWNKSVGDIINTVVPILFAAAGLILLLYLLWGGFTLMLSQGDQKAIESGKSKITTALTGFVIIFIAYWLVQLLSSILGIDQIKGNF